MTVYSALIDEYPPDYSPPDDDRELFCSLECVNARAAELGIAPDAHGPIKVQPMLPQRGHACPTCDCWDYSCYHCGAYLWPTPRPGAGPLSPDCPHCECMFLSYGWDLHE